MSTPVKLASALPAGDANGLAAIVSDLVEDPTSLRVVISIIDTKELKTSIETGEIVPIARIRRIEAIPAADMSAAKRLFRRAHEHRTGRTALPIEVEDEISAAFDAAGEA